MGEIKIKFENADQCRLLSKDNFMKYDEVIEIISGAAKNGNLQTAIFKEIDDDAKNKLMDKGFLFGKATEPNGMQFNIISWK